LMGTGRRPNTLTPNRLTRKRAALGETMATRSCSATPSSSRATARLRHVGELRIADAAQAAARRVGLVGHGLAVAIHELRALQEVSQGERDNHAGSPSMSGEASARVLGALGLLEGVDGLRGAAEDVGHGPALQARVGIDLR